MVWEYLGYFASALLVASLMMEDVTKLRWFNLAGCICFTLYGLAISAWPVAFTNGLLSFVNIYHLIKLAKKKSTTADIKADS
ncbi:YgjV family protein [Pseudoalteromonas spongiae]|mgnify:CR=1 FL=1|uniref:YgjV family protein n=1 Tax=Pseudoalteromonas spongiae TaxID=298657 RepID=A0ABU8ENV6_9GAMM|nr:YgjV family protein [Pseudoalteromonas spongiae]TMO87522.1 uroporphyrinogen decarboxylase [Pseudoalteromonas spongiae]